MKTAVAFALTAAKLAVAHTTFQSFVIDGKDQGQHTAVQTPSNGNNPILDVTSTAMICNGGKATTDFIEVTGGQEIQLQWHHNDPATTSGDSDEPIAASHKGPVMVYIAPAESNGEGDVWVKLQEDGLTDGKWGVDNFIANKGLISVTLPDLAAGEYLIRPEMIGLHEAGSEGKAQFYNGCGQLKVTGSGSATLPSGVDMTKAYSATDPGVLCNIYGGEVACTADKKAGYTIPGPAVWDGASSSGGSGSGSDSGSDDEPATPSSTATPASSATPTPTGSSPSATSSAAAQASSTPVENDDSSSTLPESFTLTEFISWLEKTAGSTNAKRFAAAFGRRAHARDFA
jgi:cellulase